MQFSVWRSPKGLLFLGQPDRLVASFPSWGEAHRFVVSHREDSNYRYHINALWR